MKTASHFNTRIGSLIDIYQGAVPLARCILEATRMQASLPDLQLTRDEFNQIFLTITFSDSSTTTLGVDEEFC